MKIQIFNANGIAGKAEEIQRFAKNWKTDILATFETWLSDEASPPITPVVANLTSSNYEIINGGKRHSGGILVNTRAAHYQAATHLIRPALDGNAAIIEANGVTIIFAYLSPTYKPDTCIVDLLALADGLVAAGAEKCVIAGDLNARSGNLASDHRTNTRGRQLETALAESVFQVQRPAPGKGKWTSFSRDGHGIPDLVLANFPIWDIQVHERATCGGSDHRPITFTIPDQTPKAKLVERWNIRRLTKPGVEAQYAEALAEEMVGRNMEGECQELSRRVMAEGLSGEELQGSVDTQWASITAAIQRAADRTVGRLKFQSRTPRDFWTQDLEQERDHVVTAQIEAQDAQLGGLESLHQVRQRFASATSKVNRYRVSIRRRRTEMFRLAVDKLGNPTNAGAFMRMVKGARKRKTGGGCALDPDQVDTYVEHFKTTFGGVPTGTPLPPAEMANAEAAAPELALGLVINMGAVTEKVKALPRGKAWGADDMPAEFLQAGIGPLAKPLTAFLSLVYTSATIPTIWRAALVVPIWKKKGDAADIGMYRPISLTCTGRRLYERLLLVDINRFTDQLADAQGGFRPHRGCPHQALTLHEALVANPRSRVALLDLRAAYDLADRARLWQSLAANYQFPPGSIRRLADLFDHNFSKLLVAGRHSKDLANLRGLLQGSSLSPALFNFLINELALQLQQGPGGLMVHGKIIRALLFADDTALLSKTCQDLAQQLAICERWSIQAGMEFSPSKCLCFAPPPPQRETPLQLYAEDLPSTDSAPYLGFPFTPTGVDFAKLCEQRCNKAKAVIASLRGIGFNATGWAPASAAHVYTAFVRPVMEYGVELKLPTPTLMLTYQRTQSMALRTMLSAPSHTSVAALHRLAGIPMFAERTRELNFLSAARFHNNDDATVYGVDIWRRALEPARSRPHKDSLPRATMTLNPLCIEFRPQLMDHTVVPLVRVNTKVRPPPLTPTERKARRIRGLVALDSGHDGIGASVKVRQDGKLHEFLTANTKVSRPDRVSITRWQLGMVARHHQCRACNQNELSREHALVCSGMDADGELGALEAAVPPAERLGKTAIDVVINHASGRMSPECAAVLVRVINTIEVKCRGRERTEQGFWK